MSTTPASFAEQLPGAEDGLVVELRPAQPLDDMRAPWTRLKMAAHSLHLCFRQEVTLRNLTFAASILAFVVYAGPTSAELAPGAAQRSADFTRAYLHVWSTDARAALAHVPRIYAPQVSFYGRLLTQDALIREKANFVRRWPIRNYGLRPGTMRVACNAEGRRCVVRSIVDWRAASAARKALSSGSSTFEQGIDFATSRPLVFREGGAVIAQKRPRERS